MPRTATVYDIFIASPVDVANEREIAVKVIHKWNDLHSLARGIMLRPVRYEKNSHPTTRYEGQEAINRQCLDNSDLVIGILGNRLGTPTSKAESGTAEEIDRHVAADKEAMIFFSQKPVPRDLSDDEKEQLEKLKAYQAKWQNKANIGFFATENEFETKFDTALTLHMNSLSFSSDSSDSTSNLKHSEVDYEALPSLGKASKQDFPTSPSVQPQYLIPEEDADLLTWVQSVLRPEGFKLLARAYDSPPRYVVGSPEKKKGFQVGFDIYYRKSYNIGKYPDFLDPSWYNGNDADEIFLKYGLIELWVESATGNFYALTPKCEELILRVRRLAQSKAEDINNPPSRLTS